MFTHCAGIKKYKIGFIGLLGNRIAHTDKHTLYMLGITYILLTTVCVYTGFWCIVKKGYKLTCLLDIITLKR